jgi:hypothetical protein
MLMSSFDINSKEKCIKRCHVRDPTSGWMTDSVPNRDPEAVIFSYALGVMSTCLGAKAALF